METQARLEALKEYVDRTKRILELSSPQVDEIKGPEDYRRHLQRSFQEIGELSSRNNEILQEQFFPLITDGDIPVGESIGTMRAFSAMLIDATSMENLDLPLIYLQTEHILEDLKDSDDVRTKIFALDSMVISCYMMINLTVRLYPEDDICFRYRDKGLEAAYELLTYLDKDAFLALPDDECRELVLINSRYMRCLFEWDDTKDRTEINKRDISLMKQALALTEDPFYRERMPDYRWDAHIFRTLQYLADFTEDNNKHGFNKEQLQEIYDYTLKLMQFLKEHPELEGGCPEVEQKYYLMRNSYFVGLISLEEYRRGLLDIMKEGDSNDFTARNMFVTLTAPLEYIFTLDPENVTEEQAKALKRIYDSVASYAYHMPKTGVLSFMLAYLATLLRFFIEVPGGVTFREMCRKIIAAMHPPTYVHTVNVAEISKYLTERLIDRDPALFVGVCDTKTAEEVRERKEEILEFVHSAAMLHDIGKLFIIETIMTYGRKLLDTEMHIIRVHTAVGAALLERFPNTREYAEIALGHHKWYDNSRGYPEDFDIRKSKYRNIISIIEAADCLDAATDSVGRSYKDGISLERYIEELQEGSGTRYAPFMAELMQDKEVIAELQEMLTQKREETYRDTYRVLKAL